jgi:hypothetical protein
MLPKDEEKLTKMELAASCGKSGRGTIAGNLVQFKSKWNSGTSGKGKTTYWYVNGKRTSLAKVKGLV